MAIECKKRNPAMIRVLCVNLEGSISGAEQSLLLLVRFLPKSIKISVACPTGPLTERLRNLGVRTHKILAPPRKFNCLFFWLFYLAVLNLQFSLVAFKEKSQIIHANSAKAILASILPRVFAEGRLIWHARDLSYSKPLAKLCGYFSSKVIAVSRAVKEKLVILGVKPELVEIVYNAVVAGNHPRERKKKNCNGPITFANIGQFVPWKKQLLFIAAAERFLQDGFNAQFLLVGDDIMGRDGRYKKELINRVGASHFASNIKIIGWQDNLATCWAQIDCLIHTTEVEPFGRVIIEAMAYGVPVIAAASCGPAEIIEDGKTGLLFTPNDIEKLIEAMKTICQDRELAHNLAINARQHIISSFHTSSTAERIVKIYEGLVTA